MYSKSVNSVRPTNTMLIECVVNISEGRDSSVIEDVATAAGVALLDVHTDPEHHRSVLSLGGTTDVVEEAARAVVRTAVVRIDLRTHEGIHPRMGAADVVPFVPLGRSISSRLPEWISDTPLDTDSSLDTVIEVRNRFARWAGETLSLPCFLYGPERSLPDIRRTGFRSLVPDTGPPTAHPTAGASAVGARRVLVAYNVWISAGDTARDGDTAPQQKDQHAAMSLSLARRIAEDLRGPAVRSLGLAVGGGAQVSCNLIDPSSVGVEAVYDKVARAVEEAGGAVEHAELVGLVPARMLAAVPSHRHAELDLDEDRTIEARLSDAHAGRTRLTRS